MAKRKTEIREVRDLRELLTGSAWRFGTRRAYREKRDGVYQDVSFSRFAADAEALATALSARFAPASRVLVIGENQYRWVLSFLALTAADCVVVPVDASLTAKEIAAVAAEVGAVGVLYAESERRKRRAFVGLTAICFDKYPALIATGKKMLCTGTDVYAARPIDPEGAAVIFHTAGTTGKTKSVLLSHAAILATLKNMARMMQLDENDAFLSHLPLSHVYECICGFLAPLYFGATVAFAEGLSHLLRNMRETHPTCMVTIPYIAEALLKKCWSEIARAGHETAVRRNIAVSDPVRPLAARQTMKESLLARERALFGGSLRRLLILGGSVDAAVQKGLRQLGVFAVQGYGMTECAGLAALNRDDRYRDGAAGLAFPDTMLDIYNPQPDGSGEIRYKGNNLMIGYLNDPARTERVLRDGWYYTGDIGRIDDEGFLHILGRKQNCLVTAAGYLICPEELERLLSQSPFIREAVVVGVLADGGKDCEPAALIVPDLAYTAEVFGKGFDEVELEGAIDAWIAGLNACLAPYQQIGIYALREKPFDRDAAGRILRTGLAEAFADSMLAE